MDDLSKGSHYNSHDENMDRSNKDDYYPMDTIPRGLCLLINNVKFEINLATRTGSEIDAFKLTKLFQDFLLFQVQLENDVTISKLRCILSDLQHEDHSDYSAFAMVFLSHGDNGGVVYCSDGNAITIKEISSHFSATRCPSLYGKPKLFFIQACRGQQSNQVVQLLHPQPRIDTSTYISHFTSPAPDLADFLFSFATIEDFAAMRDLQDGSWYINELVRIIRERARREDLSSILTKVANCVSKYEYQGQVQVSEQRLTLRKTLYFFPISEMNISSSVFPTDNFAAIGHTTNVPVSIRQPQLQAAVVVKAGLSNEQEKNCSSRCGYCLVINNTIDSTNKMDEWSQYVRSAFDTRLQLHVVIFFNLVCDAMQQLFSSVAKADYDNLECLMVIIISNGKQAKYVYGADDKKITMDDIVTYFCDQSNSTLSAIPKVFLIDTIARNGGSPISEECSIQNVFIHRVIFREKPSMTFIDHFIETILTTCDNFVFQEGIRRATELSREAQDLKTDPIIINMLQQPLQFLIPTVSFKDEGYQLGQDLVMVSAVRLNLRYAITDYIKDQQHHVMDVCQETRRSKIGGAAISFAGGVLTVIGLGLIPVTFGGSLALSATGSVIGIAGGVTILSATLSKKTVSKTRIKKVYKKILALGQIEEQFSKQIVKIDERMKSIAESLHEESSNLSIEDIITSFLQGDRVARMGIITARVGVTGAQVVRLATQVLRGGILAVRFGGAAIRGAVAVAGGVVSIVILPLDIYELVANAKKLHKKAPSKSVEPFIELLRQIEVQTEENTESTL